MIEKLGGVLGWVWDQPGACAGVCVHIGGQTMSIFGF